MPATKKLNTKLNTRVHDFFQKFKRDRGAVKVDPHARPDAEDGEGGENLPAQSQTGGREVSIAQIKQGYGEVVDTMQSVRRHLDDQAQRSDRMIQLLEGLPEVIRSLPEQNKAQTEMLRAIYQNMERQTETTGQLSTAISSLSTVGENQQKTMTELQDHLRAEDVARRELREGIGTLDNTLTEVRESSDSSRSALESISEQARQRDQAIGEMFQRSQKTTSAMMAVSWALAIVALAVSAFVAVRVTQISGENSVNAGPAATAGVTAGAQDAGNTARDAGDTARDAGDGARDNASLAETPDADTAGNATGDAASLAPLAPSESATAGEADANANAQAGGTAASGEAAESIGDADSPSPAEAADGEAMADLDVILSGESNSGSNSETDGDDAADAEEVARDNEEAQPADDTPALGG